MAQIPCAVGFEYTSPLASADLQILFTRWEPSVHPHRRVGSAPHAAIELMRVGSFTRVQQGQRAVGDANTAVLFNPDDEFEVMHGVARPNAGTTLRLLPPLLESLARAGNLSPGATGRRPLGTELERGLSIPGQLLHARLLAALKLPAERLIIDDLAYELIRCVLGCVSEPALDSAARKRVSHVRELMAADLRRRATLAGLAGAVGCSTWTLCRDFKAVVGVPLHRYLTLLRLRHACAMISDGEDCLTRVALGSGFSSHSHFSCWCRREWGLRPRDVRATLMQ